jgi:adenosylcobinamide kinase/adenosylcobinamide-phosphate guanylyltransferase
MYIFVTGGFRSGRSNYALRRASELGPPPWLYVTPGAETDDAIRKRIERHRRDGEAIWRTGVMPADLTMLLDPGALEGIGSVVLDGCTAWLERRLQREPDAKGDPTLLEEIAELSNRLSRSTTPIVVVTTEMGLGVPPHSPHEERLLKVGASANQILASNATSVILMVTGLPLKVR